MKIVTTTGESGDVFLPALYPGSSGDADVAVKLGRATDWAEADGLARGHGLRTFFHGDAGETPLTDWRELVVEVPG